MKTEWVKEGLCWVLYRGHEPQGHYYRCTLGEWTWCIGTRLGTVSRESDARDELLRLTEPNQMELF